MKNFAVIDGINIVNTIIADNADIAEAVTGKTCIEYSDDIRHRVYPGGTYEGGKLLAIKPWASWVLNDSDEWVAPKEEPLPTITTRWLWDEENVEWVEVVKASE